jgi:branched-subunit amino acid aminotransferase/4-amino-4-deoxychorismate lyase
MYPLPVPPAAPGPPGLPGLIETLRVRGGRIPFLDRHAARLAAALSDLAMPAPSEHLVALVAKHVTADDAIVRVEIRDGRATVTSREAPDTPPPRLITATVPHAPYPHKTTARTAFERAASEAWAAQADEALLLTAGKLVAEATVWTVFWWEGETLRTPALALKVLPGVARARIGELVPLVEAWSGRGELTGKSLFLANAARGIVPVAALDGEPVPPHKRTAKLARRFWPA